MPDPVDLNVLRDTLLRNQETGTVTPTAPQDKVYVDPEGRIVLGGGADQAERTLSEVPQTTFAG
ncbi:MAG: hypothetical protein WCI50_10095 [Actinomycetes bacterium]